jgi:hypothetical protein
VKGGQFVSTSIATRLDMPYTTPGGSAVNVLTDCYVDNMNCFGVGYSAYSAAGVGAHGRSGYKNNNGGNGSKTLNASLRDVNNQWT